MQSGSVKTLSVNVWLPGALPPISLAKITTVTSAIRLSVTNSIDSSVRALTWVSRAARNQITTIAAAVNGIQLAPDHHPTWSTNPLTKSPTPATVVAAYAT